MLRISATPFTLEVLPALPRLHIAIVLSCIHQYIHKTRPDVHVNAKDAWYVRQNVLNASITHRAIMWPLEQTIHSKTNWFSSLELFYT